MVVIKLLLKITISIGVKAMTMFLIIILAYLIGSIPTGYLLVKWKFKKDVRNYGSGNIGSTNVGRVAGKKYQVITTILDILKGFIPVVIADMLYKKGFVNFDRELFLIIIAFATIVGHNFTIFLKFKGGKGVSTTIGSFVYLVPIPMLIVAILFFTLKLMTNVVSIRVLVCALVLFLSTLLLRYDKYYVIATFLAFILICIRHKSNIKRIIKGEEK